MAHLTFIHGMCNKPPAAELLRIWKRTLTLAAHPVDFTNDVTCDMVYWADVLYAEPSDGSENETTPGSEKLEGVSADSTSVKLDADDPEENRWIEDFSKRLGLDADDLNKEPEQMLPGSAMEGLERIPLPWAVKKEFMRRFLRDVHHYLFNTVTEPRPGEVFQVQTEIRKRFAEKLKAGAEKSGPHIVISHSMGTVIAYDCLKRASDCPRVDGLITLGSPLGIDEIQDKLKPEWSNKDGFPHQKVAASWFNGFDLLDVVSRLDPYLANDYRKGGREEIVDMAQSNSGWWRHDIVEYLRGEVVSGAISRMLKGQAP